MFQPFIFCNVNQNRNLSALIIKASPLDQLRERLDFLNPKTC